MKKFLALLLALVMVMGLATTAFAQEKDCGDGNGTITITNASNGETYKLVKVLSATVDPTNGSIAYYGDIPAALQTVFEKDTAGNIKVITGKSDKDVTDAVAAWAKTQTATAEAVSDGTALTFSGLEYGYYAVLSTQNKGAVVTIDSTNHTATVIDKNTTSVTPPVKTVDDNDVYIGQTVTYTVKFKTANYNTRDGEQKKIVSYTIKDTLPYFLKDVNVTSISVGGTAIATQQFNADGKIVIAWVDAQGNHLYKNGAEIVITYTAVVDDDASIAGAGNTNEVSLSWNDVDGPVPPPDPDQYKSSTTIYTYALALKKVNYEGKPLAGAKFKFPFYVKAEKDTDGAYIYAGTAAGTGLINEITTPESGIIIVKGLQSGTEVSIVETEAPAGYNKLTTPVVVTPQKTTATSTNTTIILDENGNVVSEKTEKTIDVTLSIENLAVTAVAVLNKAGAELPATGGMGTTMFYIFGGTMMMAAVVLLVTKKRMADAV